MDEPMFERYTERARRVIFYSRYEASQFGSTTIEVGHLLLGLIREDKMLVPRFLPDRTIGQVRESIEQLMPRAAKLSTSMELPLSKVCKRVLAYAAEEAGRLDHPYIATEHLLLALLREEHAASAVLRELGLTLESAREESVKAPVEPAQLSRRPFGHPWVLDAETAVRIAEAILVSIVGAEAVEQARPYEALAAGPQWIVRGSPSSQDDDRLTALIERSGRIVFAGKGSG